MAKSKQFYVLCYDADARAYWPLELKPMSLTAAKDAVRHQRAGGFDNAHVYLWDAHRRRFQKHSIGFMWFSTDKLFKGPYLKDVFDSFLSGLLEAAR